MTDPVRVVVGAPVDDAGRARRALVRHGAAAVDGVDVGQGSTVVRGAFAGEAEARSAAAALRADGWSCDVRPGGGGHLAAWRRHARPVDVAGRLWVCLPWSEDDRSGAPPVVQIDPGRAFGTGAHPSTLLVLRQLALRLGAGQSVLDLGCGSGVLAVAAAVLGADPVVAVDVEPAAVEATRANAARNGVRVEASATPLAEVDGRFDAVVANIGAGPLVDLAPDLVARVAPAGWLGLSGLSVAQVSRVVAACRPLAVTAQASEDDFTAVVLEWPAAAGAS